MTTYVDLTPEERTFIAFIQNDTPGKVQVNTTISIFAALRTVRSYGSILRQTNHIRRIKIPDKYLTKLRAKYKDFKLTEFDQYAFPSTLTYTYWLNNDLHTYTYYSWPKFPFRIFGPYVKKYDKIFKCNYAIFDRSTTYPLTKKNLKK